jgi:hypothetical protein
VVGVEDDSHLGIAQGPLEESQRPELGTNAQPVGEGVERVAALDADVPVLAGNAGEPWALRPAGRRLTGGAANVVELINVPEEPATPWPVLLWPDKYHSPRLG